jgi:hypothetical protein
MAARRVIALCAALLAAAASADGAFPDSSSAILPRDRPHEIIVSTNFGLILSEDDGATWGWVCEEAIGTLVNQYLLGPAPEDALLAVSPSLGLSVSRDTGCTWTFAQDPATGTDMLDAFVDPNDRTHVLALLTIHPDGGGDRSALVESHDGAQTFGAPLFVASNNALLTGVEISRSTPGTFYLTGFTATAMPNSTRAFMVRTTNGGSTFDVVDESAVSGTGIIRLAAVDFADPLRVYLRVIGQLAEDNLGIATDGGAALHLTLQLTNPMSCFLERADGGVLVGTAEGDLFTSSDFGETFTPIMGAPHLKGLAERGGRLYATTDPLLDGFALATSDDDGAHWHPGFMFDAIQGPLSCPNIAQTCAMPWQVLLPKIKPGQHVDAGTMPPTPGHCGCEGTPWPTLIVALFMLRRRLRRPRLSR